MFLPLRSGVLIAAAIAGSALLTVAGAVFAGLRAIDGDGLDRRLVGGALLSSVPLIVIGFLWFVFGALGARPF